MGENPWSIHCTICTPTQPCSRCLTQIQDEKAWAKEHMKTCDLPLPLCVFCAGEFGLKP